MAKSNFSHKVSFVIPVFNKGLYLNQLLNSLENQSYKECEFVLVNDFSTDNSLEIINLHMQRDDRFVLINNSSNIGAAESRNKGLEVATGDYICFVDADDIVDERFLDYLLNHGYGADVIMCGASMINKNGKYLRQLNNNFDCEGHYSGFDYWKNFRWMLSSALWNKLFKRELLVKKKIRFKNIKGPEDLIFNFEAIGYDADVYYVCDALYSYRVLQDSLSKTFGLNEEINDIEVLLKINDCLLQNKYYEYSNVVKTILLKIQKIKRSNEYKKVDSFKKRIKEYDCVLKDQLKRTKLSIADKLNVLRIKSSNLK